MLLLRLRPDLQNALGALPPCFHALLPACQILHLVPVLSYFPCFLASMLNCPAWCPSAGIYRSERNVISDDDLFSPAPLSKASFEKTTKTCRNNAADGTPEPRLLNHITDAYSTKLRNSMRLLRRNAV